MKTTWFEDVELKDIRLWPFYLLAYRIKLCIKCLDSMLLASVHWHIKTFVIAIGTVDMSVGFVSIIGGYVNVIRTLLNKMTTLGYGTNLRRNVAIAIDMFNFMVCYTCSESMQFCVTWTQPIAIQEFLIFLKSNSRYTCMARPRWKGVNILWLMATIYSISLFLPAKTYVSPHPTNCSQR
jgi:hypothetical protein